MEKKICKYCKYWNATPTPVNPKKIIKSYDPAIVAISKKINDDRVKSGECTRRSNSFAIPEYEQWSGQNEYSCNKFEKKEIE